jgi:hypothetical protein
METIVNLGTFNTGSAAVTVTPQGTPGTEATKANEEVPKINECNDNKDNDGDGKADHVGIDSNGDGTIDVEPDPACF